MAKNDTLGPIEETVDEEVLKLRIASLAVPRFRGQRVRVLRTDTGRSINTADLAEALLKRADIELAIREEVARRYCLDCKKLLKRDDARRCKECYEKSHIKHVGHHCRCGKPLSAGSVGRQHRDRGLECELHCQKCKPSTPHNDKYTPYKGASCRCGKILSYQSIRSQISKKGVDCNLQCKPCSMIPFQKHTNVLCQCGKLIDRRRVQQERRRKGIQCSVRCSECAMKERHTSKQEQCTPSPSPDAHPTPLR